MKVYFLADVHFGMKGDNPIWLKDCTDYFEHVFIPYCREHVRQNDILVMLGDWFDNRSNIGLHTINCALDIMEKLSRIFLDIRLIVGNHDIFQKNSNYITSLNMFKFIPNVRIYYEPTVDTICGKTILFVPWVEDLKEQRKLLKSYETDYVFGHLEIGGCVTSHKGNKLKSDNTIQSTDFRKSQVYAGHIHIRQDFKNIHYVGTPYHKDRNDLDNTKGITILDLETGETEFVENTFSPQFKHMRIYDILDKTVGELKSEWNNNYIDLVIKSGDYPKCSFDKLREIFMNVYRGFEPICEKSDVVVESNDVQITETKSAPEILNEYLEQCDMSNDIKEGMLKKIEKIKDLL